MNGKKLVRSANNRMFLGVLGGLAEYLNVDPTLVRLGFVLVSVFSAAFPGLLVYIILALVMPEETLSASVNGFSDEEVIIKEKEVV